MRSSDFDWSILDSCIGDDSVCLPSLAAIDGEGLFPSGRIRGRHCPHIADEDSLVFVVFLVVELAASILELADSRRNRKCAIFRICPVDAPLTGVGIVGLHGQPVGVAGGVSASYSSVFARPPHIGRITLVPSASTHSSFAPVVRGWTRPRL